MLREDYIPNGPCGKTPNERWHSDGNHRWYSASTEYAIEHLRDPAGSVLVIGSPLMEAKELAAIGWSVTYLDARTPPKLKGIGFVKGSITGMPFKDKSFDAVSTACVLTHAGIGRYGDPVVDDGDLLAIEEIKRVMRHRAVITFGAVAKLEKTLVMGIAHRVYAIGDALKMLGGLKLVDVRIWSPANQRWLAADDEPTENVNNPDYLSVCVEC